MFNYNVNQNGCYHITLPELLNLIAHKTNCTPREYGKGYILRCPSHDDKKPSLSISQTNDQKKLVKCFVGCALEEVCGSIGIEVKQLFACEKCHGK